MQKFHSEGELFNYVPRRSHEVRIGNSAMGGKNPLRLQSMTTTDTNDVEGSVAQCIAIVEAGADYVRLTTQGTREAESLRAIREKLREAGYDVPLVADVHFNPNVAEVAAHYVEKVRVNPGNYVDPARVFKHIDYTDQEYAEELRRLETRFKKLLDICKQHHTALRIGVNHGSLSDRIMSRYGDTPEGIVESCMEFLRICVREAFADVVISIKASNTVVMVRSVRLLCAVMEREGMDFPLHLGVTEAGEGEDGRIKSAAGIGSLLIDGMGDTIRVSLSEAPEAEIPVARKLAQYVARRKNHPHIEAEAHASFNYLSPERRPTKAVANIGGGQVPVVISYRPDGRADSGEPTPDYLYVSQKFPDEVDENRKYVVDYSAWKPCVNVYPAFTAQQVEMLPECEAQVKFVFCRYADLEAPFIAALRCHPEVVVIAMSNHLHPAGEMRALVHKLWNEGLSNPVVVCGQYDFSAREVEDFQIASAAEASNMFFDGLADGLMLMGGNAIPVAVQDATAFAILQATRQRWEKTEYISCPGCGRTLYDLRDTIRRIKEATAHLRGLKIGIMGCIVNGPGEMADADYGYVGAARGKVSLYRGKECVEKNIPSQEAVEKLLALIESDQQARQN